MVSALNITALALIIITAVFGAVPRDTSKTLENLRGIDTAANSLTSTVSAWDGTNDNAISVVTSADSLVGLIDAANYDAAEEEVASSEDSIAITRYFNEAVYRDISASLDVMVARKADFETVGMSPDVLSAIRSVKSKTDAFGTTLWVILSTDQKEVVRSIVRQFDSDFAKAINEFS